MARRRSTSTTESRSRRKSEAEARVERITWGLLVLVFAFVELTRDRATFPNFFVPFAGALILLGSGLYQYSRRWKVSPITWIAGAFMAFFTYLAFDSGRNYVGESLVVFFVVIVFGLITGET